MKKISRRDFLKRFGQTAAAVSAAQLLGPGLSLVQAAQGTGTKRYVVYCYLSGGYDGEAFFPQLNGDSATYLRQTLRPNISAPADRYLKPFGASAVVGFHEKFDRLINAASGKLKVVTGTGITGQDPGRSHETCSKLLSLGNLDRPTTTSKGALAEISDLKGFDSLQLVGLGTFGKRMEFRADDEAPLIISDFSNFKKSGRTFGTSTSCGGRCVVDMPAEEQNLNALIDSLNGEHQVSKEFEQQYVHTLESMHRAISVINGEVAEIEPLGFYGSNAADESSTTPVGLTGFQRHCQNAERLIRYLDAHSEKDTFIIYLSLDGLDTHADQITRLNGLVADLSGGLAGLSQGLQSASSNLWSRTTFIVTSEFGRTVRQNGTLTAGTDHGWANKMLIGGGSVRGGIVGSGWAVSDLEAKNYFTPSISLFHPIVKVLEWAGISGLTSVQNGVGPIYKDGGYDLNAPLQIFA